MSRNRRTVPFSTILGLQLIQRDIEETREEIKDIKGSWCYSWFITIAERRIDILSRRIEKLIYSGEEYIKELEKEGTIVQRFDPYTGKTLFR